MEVEDNFSELPHEIFQKALKEIISDYFKTEDGDNYEITCSAGSKKGDNLLGVIYRIQVKSKCDENSTLNLILKTSPQNVARREQYLTHEIFLRETKFYREVFPMYLEFQRNKEIDIENEGFCHVAKAYKFLEDDPLEGQFFEDLSEKGFVLHDRYKPLTKDHVLLVMRALGKMHGTFLSLKDQHAEFVEKKYKNLEDLLIKIFKIENSSNLIWINEQKKEAMKALKNCKNQDLIDRVRKVLESDIIEQFEETLSGKNGEPYSVLCHGDCWNNNILYKNDNNGSPVDIRFLDFQFMRYASPASDLGYYIFGCTTKDLRDKHYHEFMDAYYETLSITIKKLGSDADKVFPRHAFHDQMRRFAKQGILMGVMLIANYVSDVSDVPDLDNINSDFKEKTEGEEGEFDKSKFTFLSDKTSSMYEKRMMDVFQDMYDLGYI